MRDYLKKTDQHRRDNVVKSIGVTEMIPVNTVKYGGKFDRNYDDLIEHIKKHY